MDEFLKQVEAAITISKTRGVEVEKESEDLGELYRRLIEMAEENSVVITISTERAALKFFPEERIDFVDLKVKGEVPVRPYTYHLLKESEEDQDELHRKFRRKMLTYILKVALKGQVGIKIEKPCA